MRKFLTLLFACVFLVSFSAVFSLKKAKADGAEKYDISSVTTVNEGEEVSVKSGTKYVGNKAIGYGDTVVFGYKNADSSKQLRMAFGIGYYGFYLYYNPNNPVTVMSCDMSGWARKTNIVTVPRDLFNDYNEIELCLAEKDEQNVRLTMTYSDGEERKTIGCDFEKVATSDGLLRFGDMNFGGNSIKSLLPAPVFGSGFTYSGENVAGENQYGGCSLAVVSKENATAAGVPEGFTGDSVLIASSGTASYDMSFDFTSSGYKRKHITGISFRLYIEKNAADSDSYPELRIPGKTEAWILRYVVGSQKTGQWITVDLGSGVIDKLCVDGTLGKFVFCIRSNGTAKMFIDSITVVTIKPDTTAPVIDAPVTRFKTTEETYPDLDYITVTDDSGACDVTYTWSEGALDFNGRLKAGNHTCTITATDGWDNETAVVIYFDVEEETPVEIYSVTFRVEGKEDYTVEYSADTVDYAIPPDDVPEKRYYDAVWDYTLEFVKGQVVTLVYKPTVYTVTYLADGEKVGEVRYTIENYDFNEPAVPKKEGYKGEWEPHEYSFENITVNAVYTKTDEPSGGESGSSDLTDSEESVTSVTSSGGSGGGCSSAVSPVAPMLTVLVALGAVISKRKREE